MSKIANKEKKNQDIFFWLMIFYLFFEVVRPADVYPFLSNIRVQLLVMILLIFSAFMTPGRQFISNNVNSYVLLFTASLCLSCVLALNGDIAWDVTYNYIKLVILYFLIIYCIKDVFYLKSFVLCFFLLVSLYMALSFREFLLGQHVYDMGVRRMLGWDGQVSPNRLGMLCVVFLPYSLLMLKKNSYVELVFSNCSILPEWAVKLIAKTSILLAIVCILLTNSRSALVLLFVFSLLYLCRHKKKKLIVVSLIVIVPLIFNTLPPETQNRYMSILYSSGIKERVRPMSRVDQWTEDSAQGRVYGLVRGLELYRQYPLLGVGPGGFQYVSGNNLQAHNLLGQVASEVGTLGLLSFLGLIYSMFRNLSKMKYENEQQDSSLYGCELRIATLDALLIMLVGSIFAHTLFFSWWLFLAAFSVLGFEYSIHQNEFVDNASNISRINNVRT